MSLLHGHHVISTRHRIHTASPEVISAHVPVRVDCAVPGCGYDSVLGGAKDPSCTVCNGSGRVTTWNVSRLMPSRVMWTDPAVMRYVHGVAMSGQSGDVVIQVALSDEQLINAVKSNPDAYLLVDAKRARIDSVTRNRVGGLTSLDVRCFLIKEE